MTTTGGGSEFRAPMAIAVIGGVITSTFLTLLVVPVIFAGVESPGRNKIARPAHVPVPSAEAAARQPAAAAQG